MSLICIDHLSVVSSGLGIRLSKIFFLQKNYTMSFKDLFFKLEVTSVEHIYLDFPRRKNVYLMVQVKINV